MILKVIKMYILDTDHISLIARGGDEGRCIIQKIAVNLNEMIAVSIISYEEQMRGWLAEIAATGIIDRQKLNYNQLERMLKYYCGTPILPLDEGSISIFHNLWIQRLRIGTMDLKIASIALSNDAILLTRNISDFSKVPGLKFEDWSA